MSRPCWILPLIPCLVPLLVSAAGAMELRWSSGDSDLAFSTATRCTLRLEATMPETRLPSGVRLQWVTDGVELRPIAQAEEACASATARVATVKDPWTTVDIAGRTVTAQLCGTSPSEPAIVEYVFDLPGDARGKLRAVALDPSDPDSMRVLESSTATLNGGLGDPFPPAVFRTRTEHRSTEFRLTAIGVGLAHFEGLGLAAKDGSWRTPLEVTAQSETSISATASLAAHVPDCLLEAATGDSVLSVDLVPPDPAPPVLTPLSGCTQHFVEDVYPPYTIQPKDFAFVPGGWTPAGSWTFHLFYIRHNQLPDVPPENTEKNLGHAVSNDLDTWTVLDTAAVRVRPGRFDSQHVWAPSIIKRGLTYYMFYTGVDAGKNQRIGLATSTDLLTWVQGDSVLSASQIPWADADPGTPYNTEDQLRDPFVMEDPNVPGGWIMYFVTVPRDYSPGMVAGFIKSSGDFHQWNPAQSAALWATLRPYTGPTGRVESPHVFFRDGKWWLFHTVNTGASLPSDTVYAVSNAVSPTDTTTVRWNARQALQDLVPVAEATAYNFWHATEYLPISVADDIEYFAAFNDAQVSISYTQMQPAGAPYLFSGSCPSAVSVDDSAALIETPRLLLTGARPARGRVGFRVELPKRSSIALAIYDVCGRRVWQSTDRELPEGVTEFSWDGRNMAGAHVPTGVYFISMLVNGTRQSMRVPVIR